MTEPNGGTMVLEPSALKVGRAQFVVAGVGDIEHEQTFAEIIELARIGDQPAFETLYERYAQRLVDYLYARTGDPHLAEDLAGDVWLRIVEHLPRFRLSEVMVEAHFASWLFRIARNLLTDMYRRAGRDRETFPQEIVDDEAGPDEQALRHEEWSEVRTALKRLTPGQRDVLHMRFFEEQCVADVALRTQRTEGAVKVLQHRAIRSLARGLNRSY